MFFFLLSILSESATRRLSASSEGGGSERRQILKLQNEKDLPKIENVRKPKNYLGKPLSTQTPKPSFTPFVRRARADGSNGIPLPFNADDENTDKLKADIARQLSSTPMIIFYSVLCLCVICAVGIFMFFSKDEDDTNKEDEQEFVAMENQLNETLDPQLANEAPMQL